MNYYVRVFRRGFYLALLFLLLCSGRAYAAGNVHALVINGRPMTKSSSEKIYNALTKNKLPRYKTSEANIHKFFYEVDSSTKCTTNEKFYAALDSAFSGSKSSDLNILYYGGHGSSGGIPTQSDVSQVDYDDLVKRLMKYNGKFICITTACAGRAFYTKGIKQVNGAADKILCLSGCADTDGTYLEVIPNHLLKSIGYDSYTSVGCDTNKDGMYSANELFPVKYNILGKSYQDGYVDGVGPGTGATVFQFTYLELSKTSVKLNKETKKKITLKADMLMHADGVEREVVWKSSNTDVVTVSEGKTTSDGTHSVVLKAKKAGKATITAYLNSTLGKCEGTEVTCEVEVTDYKGLYRALLEQGKTTYTSGGYTNTLNLTSYRVLDVNRDKIPELIVKATKPGAGAAFDAHHIYTIKSGKVKYCGYIVQRGTADIYYSKKYKALQNSGWTNFVGGTWAHLYRLKGTKLKQYKYAWEGYSDQTCKKYVYYTGKSDTKEKKVSKSVYKKFVKKYFGKKVVKKYKFLANTASNRRKTFG